MSLAQNSNKTNYASEYYFSATVGRNLRTMGYSYHSIASPPRVCNIGNISGNLTRMPVFDLALLSVSEHIPLSRDFESGREAHILRTFHRFFLLHRKKHC